MNNPKPFALLNTTTLVIELFDTRQGMREVRAALLKQEQFCVSFLWEDGNYWIDGMSGQQANRIIAALNHPEGLQHFPSQGGD